VKLLILGGTVFLGRHLVEAALARGHEVTLFNRGQHNPDLYPRLERLRGDRDGNLTALAGHRWDAVIDPSGYVPRLVRASAELLAGAVEHYTFISSISVYPQFPTAGMDEDAPTGTLDDESVETVDGDTYGPLKALCERAAEAAMPGRVFSVRAGLIVGPHDPTDRFTYWPVRVARGGNVLAPGHPDRQVQVIDARDLAEWTVRMAESRGTGVFNVTGPNYPLTMGRLLEQCQAVSGSDGRFVWVDDRFLLEHEAGPWMELPLWIPEDRPEMAGFMSVSVDRALAAGLTFRPLSDTIRATLDWHATRPPAPDTDASGLGVRGAGMKPERETELLQAWQARTP
jgi:nucleoside-diphosphate-sugar epimerase